MHILHVVGARPNFVKAALSPISGGGWTYKVIHDFGMGTDGYHPTGDLILDSAGNLYGTTQAGGAQGSGLV
jgi:hypothetical protein